MASKALAEKFDAWVVSAPAVRGWHFFGLLRGHLSYQLAKIKKRKI
jgi:hypothetical protein